jgi:predicted NACHT family NTPase
MLEWIPIIQKGAEALAPELFKGALKSASKAFQDLKPYTVLNFEDNFAIAYRRCTKVKTIVNGDVPVDLLTSYVNLNFTNKNKTVDDYGLIEVIWDKRNIVVSGPAGCGKSMFMKYLWVACFVRSRGKIPLFIELRQLNDVDFEDLTTFLFHSCAFKQQKDARVLFDKAIEEGQFFFILDGFDELIPSKADAVEKEILKLSNSGKNIVVVSGRPDDRFGAWLSFLTYRVSPLTKDQVVSLVERIEFNPVIKKKFVSQIRRSLYEAHKDFISRPLLATMMLLTYNSFAEIPSRIHVFYDQAFDTLFSRHDATKEAFKRQRYTNFEIYEFKRIFGIFCLITYIEQITEFTESTVRDFIKRAGKIAGVRLRPDALLKDIMNSVCVLQRDGLSIVFSHRSFQEYFCAYSFLKLSNDEAREVALRLSDRSSDNVMPMLFEMNKSFLEDVYFIPMMDLTKEFFIKADDEVEIKDIVEFLECGIIFQMLSRNRNHRNKEKIRGYIQSCSW